MFVWVKGHGSESHLLFVWQIQIKSVVCLYVEGNAFFQNYVDTSYVFYSLSKLQPTNVNNLLLTSLSLHPVQKMK
jgi:hypothetical protein